MSRSDSTMKVRDVIMHLRDLDPDLPIGICTSPLETPEDNLTNLSFTIENMGAFITLIPCETPTPIRLADLNYYDEMEAKDGATSDN